MFSHVMVGTNDIERSKRFYDAVLAVLGAGEPFRNQNITGQARLFYRHDGSSFCVSEPISGDPATAPTEALSASSAVRHRRCNSSMTLPLRTEAHQSKSLPACARESSALCTSLTFATLMATSSARFTGRSRWLTGGVTVNVQPDIRSSRRPAA